MRSFRILFDDNNYFFFFSSALTFPMMLAAMLSQSSANSLISFISGSDGPPGISLWPGILVPLSAVAYYLEYLLNFTYVGFVNPVTFSVSDIVRRIAIILAGAVIFSKPLTAVNFGGVAVALGGVLCYSMAEWKMTTRSTNSSSCTSSSGPTGDKASLTGSSDSQLDSS